MGDKKITKKEAIKILLKEKKRVYEKKNGMELENELAKEFDTFDWEVI